MLQKYFLSISICLFVNFNCLTAQNLYLKPIRIDSLENNAPKVDLRQLKAENRKSLLNKKQELLTQLHKQGYLEAHHLGLEKENDSLYTLPIYIGKQINTTVLKIQAEEWPEKILKATGLNKHPEITIPFTQVENKTTELHEWWRRFGYSLTELQLQNFKTVKDTLYAEVYIIKKELRRIDNILIKGYEAFPVKILHHQFGLKPKAIIDQEKIKKTNQSIENMRLAKATRDAEILFEENKTSVYLYLEKIKNNHFDGILGFATNEDSGKLEFYGNIELYLHNNLDKGESLNIKYLADGNQQQDLNIQVETPFIANSPLSMNASIRIFKRDSSFTNTNLNAKLSYKKQNWTYLAGYEQTKSTNQLNTPLPNSNIESLDGNYFLVGSKYNLYQNDFLQAIKTYASIQLGIGNRSASTNKDSQVKLELDAEHNIQLTEKYTINTKLGVKNLWSKTYYSNELYYLGGIHSIRGFNENSLPASGLLYMQTELRFKLSQEMYLHSITDIGQFKNKVDLQEKSLIGFGLGLGLHNKTGILKFQIANGKMQSQKIDLNNTRIHLSLNTRF